MPLNSVDKKINERLLTLEHWMDVDYHLDNPQEVTQLVLALTKFTSRLDDEALDYIEACKVAIEEQTNWRNDVT